MNQNGNLLFILFETPSFTF